MAVLLCREELSAGERNLGKIVEFFGISLTPVLLRGSASSVALPPGIGRREFCVLSSAACMAQTLQGSDELPGWIKEAHSVYVYGFDDAEPCVRLLRLVCGDSAAKLRRPGAASISVSVTPDHPDMCGPLSGLQITAQATGGERVFEVHDRAGQFQTIVAADGGELFCAVTCQGVRFYLNAPWTTIDITARASGYFDVRRHFASAVPIVLYLRWALDQAKPHSETPACLIVDDPLLKPRYGFLQFGKALELMDRHNFTMTIAFIPWNWKRTSRRTVEMFKKRRDRFALAVHGCDHTASEFASRSSARLHEKSRVAVERMESLTERTGLAYERIMVFPQGEFSPEAGRALKLNNFVAAVNTEVVPSQGEGNETTIADLWQVAIMKYGDFPIFTRRYLTHGIENFAFDALLGKPCLVVAHHDVFKDGGRELAEFVDQLNSLNWDLRWRTLGDVLRRSFGGGSQNAGEATIEIYANDLMVPNPSNRPVGAAVLKRKADPDCVQDAKAGDDSLSYRLKTRARRYLSEFRDNYLSQSPLLHDAAVRLKALVR